MTCCQFAKTTCGSESQIPTSTGTFMSLTGPIDDNNTQRCLGSVDNILIVAVFRRLPTEPLRVPNVKLVDNPQKLRDGTGVAE